MLTTLNRALALQLVIEEVLAPALAIADFDKRVRSVARTLRVDVIHSKCVEVCFTSTAMQGWRAHDFLSEIVQYAQEFLEGSPYVIDFLAEVALPSRSAIKLTWK